MLNGTKLGFWASADQVTLEGLRPSHVCPYERQHVEHRGLVLGSAREPCTSTRSSPYAEPGHPYHGRPRADLIENNFIEAQYTQMFTGGGQETCIPAVNRVTVTAVSGLDTCTLDGLGDSGPSPLQVGDLIAFKYAAAQSVTAAAATNPCRITVTAHRYPASVTPTGGTPQPVWRAPEVPGVFIQGATGEWSDLNTAGSHRFWGKIIDATHIDLYLWDGTQGASNVPFDATGKAGALTGTVEWYPDCTAGTAAFADIVEWQVGRVLTMIAAPR